MSEPRPGESQPGSVVLDIGGSVGALLVHAPQDAAGAEIHVHGISSGTTSTHALVRARQLPEGVRFAAVFPGLTAGAYQLLGPGGDGGCEISVTGGRVTEVPVGALAWQRATAAVR